MIDLTEATDVLDWTIAAACLRVTARGALQPCLPAAASLDEALADHFDYLRRAAPLTHMAVLALLAPRADHGAGADNRAIARLAGGSL